MLSKLYCGYSQVSKFNLANKANSYVCRLLLHSKKQGSFQLLLNKNTRFANAEFV